jgi:uncharacterized circularly permuted ATP-grasp superfamily protein/uncharacterized alpha-E superfamily protein
MALEMLSSDSSQTQIRPAFLGSDVEDSWDEMADPNGQIRPLWSRFSATISGWSSEQRADLELSAERLLEDLGATYNVYNDAGGAGRPRKIDPLPLLIDSAEWRSVSIGIGQRARLLETVLADLYGPQRLLKEGLIPPDLVHANPHFLTTLRGIQPPGGRHLIGLGFDLTRTPTGSWSVMRDHARAPRGLGQTLENRSVTASILPAEFEDCRVANLAPFFELEREALRGLSAAHITMPNVVLLTPGFRHPSYFEHAYKARVLGIPLVEAADLTVRERRLFLKTLSGLRRIDVLACRLDDDAIDPLEFWTHGGSGVPGLTEAWRSGNVALANAPGSGFAGTLALMPFLRGICEAWFGEDLKLPFVETWWLGQSSIFKHILSELENYIIFPAFTAGQPVRGSQMTQADRQQWLATLETRPHDFVVQRESPPSRSPTLEGQTLCKQGILWRTFCLQTGTGPVVLPGGLAMMVNDSATMAGDLLAEQVSKDVWVVDESATHPAEPAVRFASQPISRDPLASEVPSRMAEQLFWVGRYAERIELRTRLLRTTLRRLGGEVSPSRRQQCEACFAILRSMKILQDDGPQVGRLPVMMLSRLIHDAKHPKALPSLIRSLLWNAASARDRLSDDTWRVFNRLENLLQTGSSNPSITSQLQVLDSLILHLAAFSGMQAENMTRGHGWRFLELGRRIERSLGVLGLLESTPNPDADEVPALDPLLETCDSVMTYRRRHFSRPRWSEVVELLLVDSTNPRGVMSQAEILLKQCEKLPGDKDFGLLPMIREHVASLILPAPSPLVTPSRGDFEKRAAAFEHLSDLLTQHYFSHSVRRVY